MSALRQIASYGKGASPQVYSLPKYTLGHKILIVGCDPKADSMRLINAQICQRGFDGPEYDTGQRIHALAEQRRTGTVRTLHPHEAPRGAATANAVPFNPSVSS
ncbi:hypothetical protein GHK03_32030 [Sinorhizobium medicae]|nr:hypothetical protein [Sinorhizobium medicae]